MRPINDPKTIREALNPDSRIAIVGLSPKPHRDSHKVGQYLIDHGYEIVPVRPKADEVLGRKAYESITDIEGEVDVVDVFLNPDSVGPVVDAAIEKGAKIIWFQLGVVNEEAAEKARQAGLHVVMDRCIKIEHGELT
ncbi:CoA-binding protein [bacterium]|nr:CoA-binding protein [bacterium]